jgi:hypothetical protein
MINKENILQEVKNKILFQAISYMSIISVEEKENFDGGISLYIKTDDLQTVEMNNFNSLAKYLSDKNVDVQIVKPEIKVNGGIISENKDTVSVFINYYN